MPPFALDDDDDLDDEEEPETWQVRSIDPNPLKVS